MTTTPVPTRGADRSVRQLSAEASALWDRFPPRPITPGWGTTGRDRASVFARLAVAPFPVENHRSQLRRRGALTKVLDWLETQPGRTWQERWDASGAGVDGRIDWRLGAAKDLEKTGLRTADGRVVLELGVGLSQLICGDVLRPSQRWLLDTSSPRDLCGEMARVRDPDGFAALAAVSASGMVARNTIGIARQRVAIIMAAKGGRVPDITPGDCLELMKTSDLLPSSPGTSGVFYQLLHAAGFFPADAPPTVRMFNPAFHGQSSVEHLVDRYHLACRPIRDLLVAYLRERQPAVDYGSLTHLATTLVFSFWKDLENHHPGIDSLRLAPDVAAAWKQRMQTRTARTTGPTDTKVARLATSSVLMTVRTFYLDIAQWSANDPARWGPWVIPCPIGDDDIRYGQEQSHRKSRMDARTRERLPGLPVLVTAVDRTRTEAAALLAAAAAANPGELVTAAGQRLRRTRMSMPTPRVWAENPDTGKRRDLTREEDNAFWSWAIIEVLRGTGCRIEELTEISHHSLVQYRLPTTGELIPLLQIAPSKTDQERLLVVSPELADVFSAILHRIRTTTGAVPMVALYDTCERVWNPPMPLLFQRTIGLENRPIGINGTRRLIEGTLTHSGLTDAAGMPLPFLPHDFRRIFTTDAVMNGMPPHIAQLILGHKNINTTMGYKAVYPEEAINGHRAFIARRRELRPSEEYRTPTDEEWEEFLGHFERRRVALGDCGRAYSTPCIHEHSCLRCSLLRPDPSQRSRLVDIRNNLRERITEARQQHWLGEVAGLEVSLAAATAKLDQMDGIAARRDATVQLSIPTFTPAATHTTTSASKETR